MIDDKFWVISYGGFRWKPEISNIVIFSISVGWKSLSFLVFSWVIEPEYPDFYQKKAS